MFMLQALIGLLSWILIGLFVWQVRWRGRLVIAGFVVLSVVLPYLGDGDSTHLLWAFGFAIRVGIACVYLIWRGLPVVSP